MKEHTLIELYTMCYLSSIYFVLFYAKRNKSSTHICVAKESLGGGMEEGEVEAMNNRELFFDVFREEYGDWYVCYPLYCEAIRGGSV